MCRELFFSVAAVSLPSLSPRACADVDRDGEVKGPDFPVLKDNWYQTVPSDCEPGDPYGVHE
jgi:hypothetical protein